MISKPHVFPGSIVLRAATPDVRERAWERLLSIIDQVHPTAEQAAKPIAQVEEDVVEYVKETRRAHRARRLHG